MSKNRLRALFFILILFLLQNSFHFLFPGKCPPLLLIAVIFYSLREGSLFGMVLGVAAGLLLDLFGQGGFGFWMINLATVGVLSGYASSKIFQDSLLTEIFLPAIAFYFSTLAEIIFFQWQSGSFSGVEAISRAFLLWPFVGALVFSPVIFGWLEGFSAARSGRHRSRR